jgi:hypothetical protein
MDACDENRAGSRTNCMILLECAMDRVEQAFEATAWNISGAGVYLETVQPLEPGERVGLRFPAGLVGDLALGMPGEGEGVVRWAVAMELDEGTMYGAGMEVLTPHLDCDVCGGAIPGPDHLVTLKETVRMCRSCGLNVTSLPAGLHGKAARYLLGNVL